MSRVERENCWKTIGISGDRSCPDLAARIHCRNCPTYSAAGKVLLDREVPDTHRAAWTELLAGKKQEADGERSSVVVFRIASEWLGLPVRLVREIIPLHKVHRLPHRSDARLLGIVNIRGELQLCVSLHGLLGLAAGGGSAPIRRALPRMIVLEKAHERWVFAAEEVDGVHRIRPAEIGNLPATVGRSAVRFTRGVLGWAGKSIGLLDEELLVYALKRVTG